MLKTLFFGFMLLPLVSFAQAPQVESALDGMQTFEAEFTQVVKNEKLFREEKSSGKVWVQRPAKFYWRYDTGPQVMNIVADGINLWIDQPELKQVMVQQLADINDDLPISWLASDQPISQRYNTRKLADTTDGLQWYDLQNKKGGSQEVAFLELGMAGNVLKEVRITGTDGKVTLVSFQNAKRNQPVPAGVFQYRPAPGIDIIGTPH